MTPEELYEYNRIQLYKKRSQSKQLRRRRTIIRLVIYIILIVIFCVCSFLLGKRAGIREAVKEVRAMTMDESRGNITEAEDNGEDRMEYTRENEIGYTEDIFIKTGSDGQREGDDTEARFTNTGGTDSYVTEEERKDTGDVLLLVNRSHPLPEDYEVTLITLPDNRSRSAEEAYEPLMEMLAAGERAGLHMVVCSSYRDADRQKELFDEDVEALMRQGYTYEEAYEETAKETMPPGYSEHSTGLAFDIVAADYQMLDAGQEQTAENRWLQEHCAEYGFILRYPKGKENVTLINYESWHYRYVGKEAARYIMEHGITLEEYLE